jgi:hypothetical protein
MDAVVRQPLRAGHMHPSELPVYWLLFLSAQKMACSGAGTRLSWFAGKLNLGYCQTKSASFSARNLSRFIKEHTTCVRLAHLAQTPVPTLLWSVPSAVLATISIHTLKEEVEKEEVEHDDPVNLWSDGRSSQHTTFAGQTNPSCYHYRVDLLSGAGARFSKCIRVRFTGGVCMDCHHAVDENSRPSLAADLQTRQVVAENAGNHGEPGETRRLRRGP